MTKYIVFILAITPYFWNSEYINNLSSQNDLSYSFSLTENNSSSWVEEFAVIDVKDKDDDESNKYCLLLSNTFIDTAFNLKKCNNYGFLYKLNKLLYCIYIDLPPPSLL